MFQALSDPARRGMIDRLCAGPASVKELAAPLDMSLPSVMQHLAVLETCGLVASTKIGRVRTCTLQPETLSLAEQWLNARRIGWNESLDRLGSFLDAQDEPRTGDDT
ncbi:ArsR family transcriptional regulator [Hoeflea marina]|uniref:ArsR family transcriptional regulator n=2 Tax=Hoeflea marina TaxID=274592 RepID=A0A317PHS3_9HYPH|nr:ArsR family transcriptional regulator [Hoeflea marina]